VNGGSAQVGELLFSFQQSDSKPGFNRRFGLSDPWSYRRIQGPEVLRNVSESMRSGTAPLCGKITEEQNENI
jgi:hypothetical protein